MKWLGLTGGIATGKTTVANMLRAHGIPVICADQLAREAVHLETPGLKRVVQEFGQEILLPDGSLDRKALGKKVFGFPDRLLKLEGIVHPEVKRLQAEQRNALKVAGHQLAIYDVPLLFEKKLQGDYDAIIVVGCTPEIQLERLMKRDNLSESDAKKRIASQLPIDEKLKSADYAVMNNSDLASLKTQVATLATQLGARP